jgi:hypothetical protein
VDDFEDGTTQGWVINLLGMGAPPPAALPVNVPGGGPQGAADAYLRLTALGSASGGGRLVAINFMDQWAGDYIAEGVVRIAIQVNNLGTSDLALRLLFADPGGGPPANQAITTDAIALPAGSGWVSVVFDVGPAALTALLGTAELALSGATELRILHAPTIGFPGPEVVAALGVDDVRALPEPRALLAPAAALAALAARRRAS